MLAENWPALFLSVVSWKIEFDLYNYDECLS